MLWDIEVEAVFAQLIPVKKDTANIYATSLLCVNGDENDVVNKKVKEQCAKPKLIIFSRFVYSFTCKTSSSVSTAKLPARTAFLRAGVV